MPIMVATINAVEISFPVPRAPYAILHGHLTFEAGYTMIHLTTSELGESVGSSASFGSFVYAMPDRTNEKQVLSTTLVATGANVDYATRLAKILARRMQLPVYVGCSMNFVGTMPEEEIEGLTSLVQKIMIRFSRSKLAQQGTS